MSIQKPEPSGDERYLQRFIASIGIFLILASQLLVFSKPVTEDTLYPPYMTATLLGMTFFGLSFFIRPTPAWKKISLWFAPSRKVFWVTIAIALSVLTAVSISQYMAFTRVNYIPILIIWVLGGVAYLYAFSGDNDLDVHVIRSWLKEYRTEIGIIIAIMAMGAVFRLVHLGSIPKVMDGDEGLIGIFAQTTTSGKLANPFALWENIGAMYLQAMNLMFELFGISLFSLRLLPALGGILAIPCIYIFARQIGGPRIALLAAFMLAASHAHIHFSRIASVAYIQGTWLVPLELYFLLSGLEKRNSFRTALGGILLGMHFTVYFTAQIMLGVLLIFTFITMIGYRNWFKPATGPALAFWGGFVLMFLPELNFIVKFPNEFLARFASDGTFQSGWLQQQMAMTGQSAFAVLFERVVHAFLSLIYYPSLDFYGSSIPVLSVISTTFFLLGLLITLIHIREPKYLLLNGYFWGVTVAVGVFAIPPSADTYRMLMAVPPAFIMASIGLDAALGTLYVRWNNSRGAYVLGAGIIMAGLLIFNVWTYFGDFAGKCRYGGDITARFASYLGAYARTVDRDASIYLLSDAQYFYGSHASTDFLSLQHPITNFPDSVESIDVIIGDVIVASPARLEELEIWAREHPGGVLKSEYDCNNEILLSYIVP